MNENTVIKQKQGIGNQGTQIGIQNNTEQIENSYNDNSQITINVDNRSVKCTGPSLEEVSRLVTNLFLDNFPRMQSIARETAEARMNELWNEMVDKISKYKISDFSVFEEVDVQYSIYEAQKGYARFGTKELLSTLSLLIAERVEHNQSELCLKVAIDQAISISPMLSQQHLDYLSLLFLTKSVKMHSVKDITTLRTFLENIDSVFSYGENNPVSHLHMLGCLELSLGYSYEELAKIYNLPETQVKQMCSSNILTLAGDYRTSNVGTILAIVNAEQKTKYRFDPKIWIHS